jgi:hypothetical protein
MEPLVATDPQLRIRCHGARRQFSRHCIFHILNIYEKLPVHLKGEAMAKALRDRSDFVRKQTTRAKAS